MHITMVKKKRADGEDCGKCAEAERMLRQRGLWERVDRVVWADERDPSSEGWRLSQELGMRRAPFFVVQNGARQPVVFDSVLRFARALSAQPTASAQSAGPLPDLAQVDRELQGRGPDEVLRWGLARYGERCGLAFSGAEDVVLIDMAAASGLPFSVFCLDTGRLHAETYRFLERVRAHYGVEIELFSPDPRLLQPFVRKKGLFSFYEDGHAECCHVRKLEPLGRALGRLDAWVTGQRRDQSPATRDRLPLVQRDARFAGRSGPLVKLNPLAGWTSERVWRYVRERNVPYNPLHERGYLSIGCEPCTRPTHPGQHEREGRWWWESSDAKECGLHTAASAHAE